MYKIETALFTPVVILAFVGIDEVLMSQLTVRHCCWIALNLFITKWLIKTLRMPFCVLEVKKTQ